MSLGEKATAANSYNCPYCGFYQISYALFSVFKHEYCNQKHLIAGFLGEINRANHVKPYALTIDTANNILSDVRIPKTVMEKLEKFLYYCYLEYDFIGQEFGIDPAWLKKSFGPDRKLIIGDSGRENISYIISSELSGVIIAMEQLHWVRVTEKVADNALCFSLTTQGLLKAEQIVRGNQSSNKVFVAIEYHNDYRKTMDLAITPACDACGFQAFLASDTEHNHNINDEMIVDIKRSKFIISDFTNNNEGAYYEAGYAEGLGLPVIKCCHKDSIDKLHFDVNHDKFIVYSDLSDYKNQLKTRIRATITKAILED